jgi:hypothetical protein
MPYGSPFLGEVHDPEAVESAEGDLASIRRERGLHDAPDAHGAVWNGKLVHHERRQIALNIDDERNDPPPAGGELDAMDFAAESDDQRSGIRGEGVARRQIPGVSIGACPERGRRVQLL